MIGIYKLNFANGNYIGQSVDIDKRIKSHLSSKGRGSPKLSNAFTNDTYLGFEVLEEIDLTQLSNREEYWITKFKPNLNVLPGGESLRGLNSPRCKYSKQQIEYVINLFMDTDYSYSEISRLTEVNVASVHDMCKGRSQHWATQDKDIETPRAAREHLKYVKVYDEEGKEYLVESHIEFEQEHNLPQGTITRLFTNKSAKSGRFSLLKPDLTKYLLTSDEGLQFEVTKEEAKTIMKDCGVNYYAIDRVLSHHKSKGWSLSKSIITTP